MGLLKLIISLLKLWNTNYKIKQSILKYKLIKDAYIHVCAIKHTIKVN